MGSFLFFIVGEKRKKTQQVHVELPVESTAGSAHIRRHREVLSCFNQNSDRVPHTDICRSGKCLFPLSSVFTLWSLPVRIHSPRLRQMATYLCHHTHTLLNTSARPFSSCLSKHTFAGKQAIH